MEITKIDKYTVKVIRTKPEQVLPGQNYDLTFLKNQLIAIQKQKASDNILRDAEISEVQALINESLSLGIVEKPKDNG